MRKKYQKKLYWCIPKDLPVGSYTCTLKITESDKGRKARLIVRVKKEILDL